MSIQLTIHSFLQLLGRSQLLNPAQLIDVHERFENSFNGSDSASGIGDWMVEQELLTRWQADKLLKGKHRGFFLGPYKILTKIARGGMSTIYAAEHLDTGELRALKVLPASKADKASYLPRFFREGEIAKRLRHPNIVRVYGVHSESDGRNDVHFLAMELLDGHDLAEVVRTEGPLACRTAAEYIRQAATGLQYAHSAGLVHRDVKPGNLFRTHDGTIRIVDLGLAQDFESTESLTREYNERILGTADYLSPEQALDSHKVDARADIYGLGCTFYFLLTGRPPFSEGTLMQRIVAHQKDAPRPLTSIRSDIPEDLSDIVGRMVQKNPDDRFQTALELAARLRDWLKSTTGQKELDQKPELSVADAPADEKFQATPREQAMPGAQAGFGDTTCPEKSPVAEADVVQETPETGSGAEASFLIEAEGFEHFLHILDDAADTEGQAGAEALAGIEAESPAVADAPVETVDRIRAISPRTVAAAKQTDITADLTATPGQTGVTDVTAAAVPAIRRPPRVAEPRISDTARAAWRTGLLLLLAILMFPAGFMTAVIWPDLVPMVRQWLLSIPLNQICLSLSFLLT